MIQQGKQIVPFLWFNNEAEEAVNFYTTVFKNSKITALTRYGAEGPGPAGQVMTMGFELNGQEFMALNGGPIFHFTEAVSFYIKCETQKDIDYYWDTLLAGGNAQQCGWLKDKYGLSWQVVPVQLGEMLLDKDPEKAKRVFHAMMQMVKIDLQKLQDAYNG